MITTNVWPQETTADLTRFYGPIPVREGGLPTYAWEAANLVWIKPPYPMRAAWDGNIPIVRIRCHRRVAESLTGVLAAILERYGTVKSLRALRLNVFGGTYAYRPIRAGRRLSLHAYGAAIDLDPQHNPLGKIWKPNGMMMDLGVVELFEAAGWKWGGRFRGRKDCMHFQAAG